jgi:hypothetical protein
MDNTSQMLVYFVAKWGIERGMAGKLQNKKQQAERSILKLRRQFEIHLLLILCVVFYICNPLRNFGKTAGIVFHKRLIKSFQFGLLRVIIFNINVSA